MTLSTNVMLRDYANQGHWGAEKRVQARELGLVAKVPSKAHGIITAGRPLSQTSITTVNQISNILI